MLQENGSSEGKKVFLPIKKNIGLSKPTINKIISISTFADAKTISTCLSL